MLYYKHISMRTIPLLLGLLLLVSPGTSFAQNQNNQEDQFGDFEAPLPNIGENNIDTFIGEGDNNPLTKYMGIVITFITGGIVVIALISMVVGGYIYMTAGGSSERVSTAKSYFSAAILGIALALTAYLILNTISPQFASELKDPIPPAGQGN